MLWSRIDEQSGSISELTDRVDKMSLQNQVLQKVNSDLLDQAAQRQMELDDEKERRDIRKKDLPIWLPTIEQVFTFMEEHKAQNAQLKLENKWLQLENDSHESMKESISNLTKEKDKLLIISEEKEKVIHVNKTPQCNTHI